MESVTSKDGTTIAYDKSGQGPAVVLVGGGMTDRKDGEGLAKALAANYTVYNFDRRGRGDSGNTLPFAVDREIEDIAAMIQAAGGSAFLYGISSGGALALRATAKLPQVKKLALYEVPFNDDPEAVHRWKQYVSDLTNALVQNNRGKAVTIFLRLVGARDEDIAGMRSMPMWQGMESRAPTLKHDQMALGDTATVPVEFASTVKTPTIVITGTGGYPFMPVSAKKLSEAIPNAQYRELQGQTHDVNPEVLAPVLTEFFAG